MESNTVKKVYGYIRVSTETQADKGYGLETQRDAIIKHCKDNNLELVQIFADEGISGKIGDNDDINNRPALSDLLNTLNGTNTIVVMNTSRLWRDMEAQVLIVRKIKKLGGDIKSIESPTYSLYSKNAQDFLVNSMMELLDQYDRMLINSRLKKGLQTKSKQGEKPCGQANYGYQWDNKKLIINPEESIVVKRMFSLIKDGLSYQKITDILNSEGILTTRGNKWSKKTIHQIIHNKIYIGIVSYDGKEYEGTHEPIISLEIWDSIHEEK